MLGTGSPQRAAAILACSTLLCAVCFWAGCDTVPADTSTGTDHSTTDSNTNSNTDSNTQGDPGPQGPQGDPGPQGPAGATGAQGAEGDLRVYGDGSAGALTVSGGKTLYTDVATTGNTQFTNLTIGAGAALYVPSGTVLRCTGAFVNNGNLVVQAVAAVGGSSYNYSYFNPPNYQWTYRPPGASVGGSTAEGGTFGEYTDYCPGGRGGTGLSDDEARALLMPGVIGGGGGGGALSVGGDGGGTVVILAKTSITNSGDITANGTTPFNGGGGGGGGIVVLASPGPVANLGTIHARGGDGGTSNNFNSVGGGGGGGIVHFLSPNVTAGTVVAIGGKAGVAGFKVNQDPHCGGGGGGACGGSGGHGGDVPVFSGGNATPTAGTSGESGYKLVTAINPTLLFH